MEVWLMRGLIIGGYESSAYGCGVLLVVGVDKIC